jgi:RNA polymerase sigma-70 factor (ECF subfamily)
LVALFEQPVFRFVYRLIDDPADAPDVTQEVFIKIFRKIDSFRGDCSLKTWVYRIAINEAANRRRWFSRHRRNTVSIDDNENASPGDGGWFVDRRESPFDTVQRKQVMDIIQKCLRGIDPRLRSAVVLRDLEGLEYSEIANVLNVPLGTVKSRILRGREALKVRLQHELPAPVLDACLLQTE